MKCYNCGYEGDSLDFTDITPIDEHTVEPTSFKVCPKCRKVQ